MIKDLAINGKKVAFTLELTTPACPLKDMLTNACVNAIKYFVDSQAAVSVHVTYKVIGLKTASQLKEIKNIILVSSGKAGWVSLRSK